jgi:hypothetical protein
MAMQLAMEFAKSVILQQSIIKTTEAAKPITTAQIVHPAIRTALDFQEPAVVQIVWDVTSR